MRRCILLFILMASIFTSAQGMSLYLNNSTNSIMGDGLYFIFNNPAAMAQSDIKRYYVSMDDLFDVEAFGASFPLNNLQLAVLGNNTGVFREIHLNGKGVFFNSFHLGLSFLTIYEKSDEWLDFKYSTEAGVTWYPFSKQFRNSGQLTDIAVSAYLKNMKRSSEINSSYPFTFGFSMGFFYKKEVFSLFVDFNKSSGDEPRFGLGAAYLLNPNTKLHAGARLDGVGLGCEYSWKDMIFSAGFNRTAGNSDISFGLHIIPGNTKNVLIGEYLAIGIGHYKRKDYEKATEYFNKVLGISPDNVDAKQFIQITRERSEKDRAAALNNRILKIIKMIKAEKYDRAKKEYTKLQNTYPGERKKWSKIEEMFPKSKKAERKDLPSKNTELDLLEKSILEGDIESSQNLVEKLSNIDMRVQDSARFTALQEELIKVKEELVEELKASLPESDTPETLPVLEKILFLQPDNRFAKNRIISYYLKLGEEYYRDEKFTQALELWEKVLDLDPENRDALLYIDTVKKRMK